VEATRSVTRSLQHLVVYGLRPTPDPTLNPSPSPSPSPNPNPYPNPSPNPSPNPNPNPNPNQVYGLRTDRSGKASKVVRG